MKQLSDDTFFRMSLLTTVFSISEKLGRLDDLESASEAMRYISANFQSFTKYSWASIRNAKPI